MSGYNGYSMSNNAVMAYDNGEKPYSKWTKAEILREAADQGLHSDLAKKLTVAEARGLFLKWSSWHHTSSMYNRTDFYVVDATDVTDERIAEIIANREPKKTSKEEKPKMEKAYVRYGEWTGTRKHPKLVEKEAYAIIVGKWAYILEGKKRTDGKHFWILEKYARAPKGTADVFKKIEKTI